MSGVRLAADRFAGLASAPSGPPLPLIINQAVLRTFPSSFATVLANLSGEVFSNRRADWTSFAAQRRPVPCASTPCRPPWASR